MGWRSDYPISRGYALNEILRKITELTDDDMSRLMDLLHPDRTVNYRIVDETEAGRFDRDG